MSMRTWMLVLGLVTIIICGGIAGTFFALRHHEVQRFVAFQQSLAEKHHLPLGPDGHHWGEYSQHGVYVRGDVTSPLLTLHDVETRIAASRSATSVDELYAFYDARTYRQDLLKQFPLELFEQSKRDLGPSDAELNRITVTIVRHEILRIPADEALAWSSPLRAHHSWNSLTSLIDDVTDWWTLPAALTNYVQWLAGIADRAEAGERLTVRELSSPPTGMRMMGPVSPPSTAIILMLHE